MGQDLKHIFLWGWKSYQLHQLTSNQQSCRRICAARGLLLPYLTITFQQALLIFSKFHSFNIGFKAKFSNAFQLMIIPEEDLVHRKFRMWSSTNQCQNVTSEQHLRNPNSTVKFCTGLKVSIIVLILSVLWDTYLVWMCPWKGECWRFWILSEFHRRSNLGPNWSQYRESRLSQYSCLFEKYLIYYLIFIKVHHL